MGSLSNTVPSVSSTSSPRNSYSSSSGSVDQSSASSRSSFASFRDSFPVLPRISSTYRTGTVDRRDSFSRIRNHSVSYSGSRSNRNSLVLDSDSTPAWENNAVATASQELSESTRDGPTALRELKDVEDVICVAFGVFDRYYICWKDISGNYKQEGQRLPARLHSWLFPLDRGTRDLATVQVSLGSNDEFFASDKNERISSRDSPAPQTSMPDTPTRRKAHTLSSSMSKEALEQLDPDPIAPRLIRRQTESFGRADSRTKSMEPGGNRRSLLINGTEMRQTSIVKKVLPKLKTRGSMEALSKRSRYVDAGVQTDNVECCERNSSKVSKHEYSAPAVVYVHVETRNPVRIGSMQDFCRQISLGDALGYV